MIHKLSTTLDSYKDKYIKLSPREIELWGLCALYGSSYIGNIDEISMVWNDEEKNMYITNSATFTY